MTAERNEVLAHAFEELGRACQVVAAALHLPGGDQQPTKKASSAQAHEPRAPKQKPLALSQEPVALGKTDRRVLLALAQLGRSLNMDELAFYIGVSRTSGGFGQALADLRKDGLIEGPGAAIEITAAGRVELGEFTPLPTGHELFAFWCSKLGTTHEKVLRALHKSRSALNMDALSEATGLSRTSGGLGQALADLRKMRLIDGPGSAMRLSADFKRAIEPTIGVFDMSSGRSVRVDTKGNAR